jgi:hypothetical protein
MNHCHQAEIKELFQTFPRDKQNTAIAQLACRRPLTVKERVQFESSSRMISAGQSSIGTIFSTITSVFLY